MSERLSINPCEACPRKTGAILQELAAQYQPPEEWLFGKNDFGTPYSLDAIRTAHTFFRTTDVRSDSGYYKSPKPIGTEREIPLIRAKRVDGVMFPEEFARLQKVAEQRAAEVAAFTALSDHQKQLFAERTKPFLDDWAVELSGMDPAFAELEPLAKILGERREEHPTLTDAGKIGHYAISLRRGHYLDQGAFSLAKRHNDDCDGPMTYLKEARSILHPLKRRPSIEQVCFKGPTTPKDRHYFEALYQHRRNK